MIEVEPCPKCTGWHPQRSTCPSRRRQVPPGLRVCRHCDRFHLLSTPDVCSQHLRCDCDEKAKLKIEIEHLARGEWTAVARIRDRYVSAQSRTLELLLEKIHEELVMKGLTR